MSSNRVTVICQWGGNIVSNSQDGMNYVGGEQVCIRVKPDISFRQLVSKMYGLTRIDRGTHKIKMTCRFPAYFDTHCTFTPLPIVDNDSVEAMLGAVVESTRLACIHLYIDIERVENDLLGDVSRTNSIHVPLPTIHEVNPSLTRNQLYEFSQTEGYMNSVHEESPWRTPNPRIHMVQPEIDMTAVNDWVPSMTQHQSSGLSTPAIQAQYSHHMFPDLNAPASTSGTDFRGCTSMENVIRLVQHDDDNIADPGMSDEAYSDMSADSAHSDDGLPAEYRHFDDEERGEPSTSMVRMFEPIADFFTHVDNSVQPVDAPHSQLVGSSVFDPKRDELRKGLLFDDKESLQDAVLKYNIFHQRHITVGRNSNHTCWEVFCKFRHTSNCLWRLRGSLQRRHGLFEIVTYEGPHTCTFEGINTDHPGLTSSLICREIYALVKDAPSFRVSSIVALMKKDYSFTTTYQKAWNAKQKAVGLIFGDWLKSYQLLPKFLGAIKKYNEGTIVHYDTNPTLENPAKYTIFQRVFWAFAPCIEGFKSCRPMVSIDATFLYGKYKGKILIATGKDANGQVFPLAFAIVDEESRSNWGWFLYILRRDVVGNKPGLCLISDRHKGILAAVQDVGNGWDESIAHHRFCLRHVQSNFNTKFKNAQLKKLMWEAGAALEIRHFNYAMSQIKKINRSAWEYLVAIPPEKWTLSHDGGFRFGDTTTNIVECFNGVLKSARCLPITTCVQAIFFKCVAYFDARRAEGLKAKSEGKIFTHSTQLTLEGISTRSGSLTVYSFNRDTGEAGVVTERGGQHAVLTSQHMCTCGFWQTYKIPCTHAVEVLKTLAVSSWAYISPYYTIDTYLQNWGPKFHPLYPEEYWDEPIGPIWIPDPTLRREKGRPRSTRICNEMDIREPSTTNCCGICRQPGHDRRRI